MQPTQTYPPTKQAAKESLKQATNQATEMGGMPTSELVSSVNKLEGFTVVLPIKRWA